MSRIINSVCGFPLMDETKKLTERVFIYIFAVSIFQDQKTFTVYMYFPLACIDLLVFAEILEQRLQG